jgi:hypothetical protein
MLEAKDVTVLFVPFYGGTKASLKKHIELVENLGFKTKFVELEFSILRILAKPFSAQTMHFGMKALWADQIESALNGISGEKILYAFSTPSAGAIEAIGRRAGHEVLGLVAEGGPTGEIWQSLLNYFTFEKPIQLWPARYIATTFCSYLLNPELNDRGDEDFKRIPPGFPVLSIRGWKDPLISPKQIDLIFEPHQHILWKKLALPEAKHLNGLKDFRSDYEPAVSSFLNDLTRLTKKM